MVRLYKDLDSAFQGSCLPYRILDASELRGWMLKRTLRRCKSRPDPETNRLTGSLHSGTAHALAPSSLLRYTTPGTLGEGADAKASGRRALAHLLVGLVEEHAVNRVRLLELHRPLAQLQVVVLAAHGWGRLSSSAEAAASDPGHRSAAVLGPAPHST